MAAVWKTTATPAQLQQMLQHTMDEHIGVRIEEVGEDWLSASMPVDHRTTQPVGLLHGGASCVLAETLGSIASNLCVDRSRQVCVGLDINANHVKGVTGGRVTGTTRAFHVGSRTHVWHIEIRDEQGALVCVARLTTAVLDRPGVNPAEGLQAGRRPDMYP